MSPEVTMYIDGGASPNPGAGAYAAVLLFGAHQKEVVGTLDYATNNAAELTAAIEGLKALKQPCTVKIISDSQYVVMGGSGKWSRNANQTLWLRLEQAMMGHTVTWEWVRGHAGNLQNERCHRLVEHALRSMTG